MKIYIALKYTDSRHIEPIKRVEVLGAFGDYELAHRCVRDTIIGEYRNEDLVIYDENNCRVMNIYFMIQESSI